MVGTSSKVGSPQGDASRNGSNGNGAHGNGILMDSKDARIGQRSHVDRNVALETKEATVVAMSTEDIGLLKGTYRNYKKKRKRRRREEEERLIRLIRLI